MLYIIRSAQLTTYILPVQAADDGTCPGCPPTGPILESEVVNITVNVVDRNLRAPKFTACPATMTLKELAPAGTLIGKVSCVHIGYFCYS